MKIAKLSVVLEKRDFREWVTQCLRSVVPDSVAISSVALDGLTILIKGRADVGVIKHDFEAAFEMSPAKDGDALLLKLKKANPLLNGILKAVFPEMSGLDYSWWAGGITISFNQLLRPMGISIAKLTGITPNSGSVVLNFDKTN